MTLHDLATKHELRLRSDDEILERESQKQSFRAHNLFGTTLPANRVDSVFALAQKTREEK